MSTRATIQSYYQIIERLRSGQKPTKAELLNFLRHEGLVNSDRTLERRLQEIRDEFKLDIRYIPSDKTYSLEDTDDDTLNSILRFLEVNAVVGIVSGDAISRFSFSTDGSYKGLVHIRTLLNAIQTRNKINFTHQKFTDDKPKQVKNLCPVLLREYLGRWYVAGFFGHHEDNLFTYGLDRIAEIEVTTDVFEVTIDPAKAFETVIGVSIRKPEVVELEFTSHQANYLKTLPWHKSQEIVSENGEATVFRFFISPNYELMQKILMTGPEVKVLKPAWLVDEIRELLDRSLKKYKRKK